MLLDVHPPKLRLSRATESAVAVHERNPLAIRGEAQLGGTSGKVLDGVDFLPLLHVPEAEGFVLRGASKGLPIRGEGNGLNHVEVPLKFVSDLAAVDVVQDDSILRLRRTADEIACRGNGERHPASAELLLLS